MTNLLLSISLFFSLNGLFFKSAYGSVPSRAFRFGFNIKKFKMDSAQEQKVDAAAEMLKEIVTSEEFRRLVINHTYQGNKTFVDNKGLSNIEIYNILLDGAEELNPSKNSMMDIEVELYSNEWTSTVGFTRRDTNRIWVNTKFFNSYKPHKVARNLMHEWLHKLGFNHASSYSDSRNYSVPYGIGTIVENLASKL